jgi:hypothetical protein
MGKRRIRINKRLTGVSVPLGGLSWETVPDVEREVLSRLIPFLENSRVLYNPSEVEEPDRCVESILRLRQFLIEQAGILKLDSPLQHILRSMAASCRAFLDQVPGPHRHTALGPMFGWDSHSWVFNQALGPLRGQIGIYLAQLASDYGLTITRPLATILPPDS